MKNARTYEKKIKKLLARMRKPRSAAPSADGDDRVAVMVRSVLEEDAFRDQAGRAFSALQEEYVDFNELRVSPLKEIVERMGKNHPSARSKAEMLSRSLSAVYDKTSTVSMDYMEKMTKRDLRRHLLEIGLSPYVAACVVLRGFEGHAIPVDHTLVECLEMQGYIHPGSTLSDVQGFLERIISQKNAPAAHELLRSYIKKCAKPLAAKRRAEARAKAAAERKKAEEEAAAKAEAERKAAEAARKKAKRAKALAKKKKPKTARARKPKPRAKPKGTKKAKKAQKKKKIRRQKAKKKAK
jgi:endonuclease-3